MNDQTIELLNRMADEFGTTVEHLWGVLIKQAAISAVTEVLMAVFCVAVWLFVFRFVRAKTTVPAKTETERYPEADWEGEAAFFAWAVVAIATLITVVQIYCATTTAITAWINPEYWAIKQLLP